VGSQEEDKQSHLFSRSFSLVSCDQWQSITITLVEKVQIIAVFLGSLFLVASISWLLWSALSPQAIWQRRDVLFQICYGMYGFMDLVCVGEPPNESRIRRQKKKREEVEARLGHANNPEVNAG